MFENVTFEMVLERMLNRIDDVYDKRESSPIYAALAPSALEITNIYAALDDMMEETFADTASREYLIRLAASRGIAPYPAAKAVVLAKYIPDTAAVSEGMEFTSDAMVYRVMEKTEDGTCKLECTQPGEIGNAYLGEVMPVDYVEGLESMQIAKVLIYGEDEEDTEAFRKRYMDSFQANSFGGNRADYQKKAMAVAGVGAVKVIPVWNGAGTVKLVILGADYGKASHELLQEVQAVFDPNRDGLGSGLAPIGHRVTIDTVTETEVQIAAAITFDAGYEWNACKIPIESAINLYFANIRKEWEKRENAVVRISSVNMAILSVEGVLDVNGTRLNGAEENLTLGAYDIPVFGGISYE